MWNSDKGGHAKAVAEVLQPPLDADLTWVSTCLPDTNCYICNTFVQHLNDIWHYLMQWYCSQYSLRVLICAYFIGDGVEHKCHAMLWPIPCGASSFAFGVNAASVQAVKILRTSLCWRDQMHLHLSSHMIICTYLCIHILKYTQSFDVICRTEHVHNTVLNRWSATSVRGYPEQVSRSLRSAAEKSVRRRCISTRPRLVDWMVGEFRVD